MPAAGKPKPATAPSVLRGCAWLLLLACAAAGCAAAPGGSSPGGLARLQDFAGVYEGSFASALSPQPEDDLNFDSCDERVEDCATQQDPLVDIAFKLTPRDDGGLDAAFYRNPGDARPMDLLGRGCGTSVGALEALAADASLPDQRYTLRYALNIENRLCAGRLRPTSTHFMVVKLFEGGDGQRAEVLIDKAVVSKNYLYVEEDGVQRRVQIDLDNTPSRPRRGGYRVCIEDDAGEFSRCVVTDKELKQVVLPVPVPGGVAANYTWWYDLTPNLKRTRGLYELEQYVGRFDRLAR